MLITEAQMSIKQRIDAMSLLENMQYVAESVFSPAMVPIVENTNLHANIIPLESMTEFCEANNIVDFGYALQTVCEASQVDPSTICFSVQEENVIADQDMAELVAGIMNEGVGVVVKPLPSYDNAMIIAEATLDYAFQTGDYSLFEAYLTDDYDYLLEAVKYNGASFDPIESIATLRHNGKIYTKKFATPNQNAFKAWVDDFYNRKRTKIDQASRRTESNPTAAKSGSNLSSDTKASLDLQLGANRQPSGGTEDRPVSSNGSFRMRNHALSRSDRALADLELQGQQSSNPGPKPSNEAPKSAPAASQPEAPKPADVKKAEETAEAIKNQADEKAKQDPKGFRNWCARQIASLRNIVAKFNQEVKNAGDKAPWYKKVISYITRAIQWLTEKMHNAFAKDGANFLDKQYATM